MSCFGSWAAVDRVGVTVGQLEINAVNGWFGVCGRERGIRETYARLWAVQPMVRLWGRRIC